MRFVVKFDFNNKRLLIEHPRPGVMALKKAGFKAIKLPVAIKP